MGATERVLWSTQDIARASGLTPRRVAQLLSQGVILGQKFGRDWIIQRDEALRFIAAHVKYRHKREVEEPEDS